MLFVRNGTFEQSSCEQGSRVNAVEALSDGQ